MKKIYNNKVLENFFVLQPIIDIITGVMLANYNLALSVGMIVRFTFLLYASVYILKNRNKKVNIYICLWILYIIISTVGNYFIKDSFSIMTQLKDLLHLCYLPALLLYFYIYFNKHKKLDNKVFTYMGIITGVSLLISILTDTSYCTYSDTLLCYDRGYLGWFNSGNEYGLILTALLGYQLINYIKNKKLINYFAVALIVLFLSVLGTKTSFLGLTALLLFFIVYETILMLCKKEFAKNGKYIGFIFILVIMVGISLTKLPIYYNMKLIYTETVKVVTETQPEITEEELNTVVGNTLIYSGRNDYIKLNKQMFDESPVFNKLFGMTSQGNKIDGIEYNHINERDFHDIYMYYGIVALILELILPIMMCIEILKNIKDNIINTLKNEEFMISSLVLALLVYVSYMAGHLVTQPAVVIYFSYIFNMIVKESRRKS